MKRVGQYVVVGFFMGFPLCSMEQEGDRTISNEEKSQSRTFVEAKRKSFTEKIAESEHLQRSLDELKEASCEHAEDNAWRENSSSEVNQAFVKKNSSFAPLEPFLNMMKWCKECIVGSDK